MRRQDVKMQKTRRTALHYIEPPDAVLQSSLEMTYPSEEVLDYRIFCQRVGERECYKVAPYESVQPVAVFSTGFQDEA